MLYRFYKSTFCCFFLCLFASSVTHAVDATFNPATRSLQIFALQIGDDVISVDLLLRENGCLSITSTGPATQPFTGATYEPVALFATLPSIAVGNNLFSANVQFLRGCFRATNIVDISSLGKTGSPIDCPPLRVGDTQTFTTTIETTISFTTTVSSTDSIVMVTSNNGSTAILERQTIEENGSLSDDNMETIELSGDEQILIEAFTYTGSEKGFTTRQVTGFPICPVPPVGTVYFFEVINQGSTQPSSTITRTIDSIVPNVVVSTPAGDFVATRVDSTLEQDVPGVTLPPGQVMSFYVDGIGIVKQVSTNEFNDTSSIAIQELVSSNF